MLERQHIVDLEKQIREEIGKLSAITPEPCILKIPPNLREVSPKAYTPSQVAIGPLHADTKQLRLMEAHKLRYLKSLMSRSGGQTEHDYIVKIENRVSEAWECYSGIEGQLDPQKFLKMLLLDGAFIVEFFYRRHEKRVSNINESTKRRSECDSDPIFDNKRTRYEVCRDLLLLENQLPFFILEDLYYCTFSSKNPSMITLVELAYDCLGDWIPIQSRQKLSNSEVKQRTSQEKVMHLVHLMRMCCLAVPTPPHPRDASEGNPSNKVLNRDGLHFHPLYLCSKLLSCWGVKEKQHEDRGRCRISATELHEAGIKFKSLEDEKSIDIKFDEARRVVEMPRLRLNGRTEMFFRNVMAFEQYHLDKFEITNYMGFMDELIDIPKDVHILEESHLIDNWLESREDVATVFNNIVKNTVTDHWEYKELSNRLTAYTMKPWNKWKAMLRRDYFGSPWAIISFVAAVVLLGLTAVQTIAAIQSIKWY